MDLIMRDRKSIVLSIVIGVILQLGQGCEIANHLWIVPIQAEILDVHEGIVLTRDTTDIIGIHNAVYSEAILGGPYFDIFIENSQLIVRTNEAFRQYEELEVEQRVAITLEVNCAGGTTRGGLFVWIDLTDTNNNSPTFEPSDEYEFVIMPPLPPGYYITGCYNDPIIARDIDLTTQRIDFAIEDNPYFEIIYDAESSTVAKQFNAQLRTKTLLRSLSEPLVLQITATDVDLTPGPPRTTAGVVRIVPDAQFQFPEELVFTQTFYLANYTDGHQLNLLETISLRQGFDEYVNFALEGEHAENFELIEEEGENQLSIVVKTNLSDEVMSEGQILLIVTAQREYTSGSSATVIVQFPQGKELQFESAIYEGSIVNNSLQVTPLVLSQGYGEETISAEVFGEHSSYFAASVSEGVVTLTMEQLPAVVIDSNSFISVQVVASVGGSSAFTVVNLDIIKDDKVTPVFNQSIYSGSYDPLAGLSVEQIEFVQGFDDTVSVELVGEHSNLFQIVDTGPIVTLTSSPIPAEMFSQRKILLTIVASKPRTVGANAAITIALPAARVLEFEESTYRGTLQGGGLALESIRLTQGYEDGVTFSVSGEHATYFNTTNDQGEVSVVLSRALPDTVISQNSAILLTLDASGVNAITTSTNILLDVIKDDTTTPIFNSAIYTGTYSGGSIEIEAINLAQGFDDGVSFRLDGAHAVYFTVERVGTNAVITLQGPVPEDVILREKVLAFSVIADKALTVGANAAVIIRFPTELTDLAVMEFSQNTYVGTFIENEIRLENIVLETGFETGTELILSGDYADHFYLLNTASENIKQLSSNDTLPAEALINSLIVLEVEARRPRAVPVWTSLILDVVKQEVIAPVFDHAFYTGAYSEETGLTFGQDINLSEGFDATVTFALSEEVNDWFDLEQGGNENSLSLVLKTPIPSEVLATNSNMLFTIVANKPSGVSGRAVIFIDLHTDISDSLFRFQEHFYKGSFDNGAITLEEIVLEEYTSDVNYTLIGDHAENFHLSNENGIFTILLETPIPNNILEETGTFVFTLKADNSYATAFTIIVLENRRTIDGDQQIEFEYPYYLGTYSSSVDLQFDAEIKLTTEVTNTNFELEGEDAEWFALERTASGVTVTLRSTIPAAVLTSNQQLVFVVTAQGPATNTARATVIITLTDTISETLVILGFNQNTYLGSIENNQANISIITLSQGYSQAVEFRLHGELTDYFKITPDGASITITIPDGIPQEHIPSNRIIVLEIQATAPDAVPAYSTIVFEYVTEDIDTPVVELIFAQTFYSGSYGAATGLEFQTPIILSQGYDSNVLIDLEGDDAEWFALELTDSGVIVTLRSTIPAAVLTSNQQLVFVVTAQGPATNTARATVIITLTDTISEIPVILGFNQITYLGSIENNQANIPIISLSQGYSQDVKFRLHGELSDYFRITPDGASITITILGGIPQEQIPSNRIIVLEIQATAPDAVPAYSTIVIEYVTEDIVTPVAELIFEQTFYSGSYAAATGLEFQTTIDLSQGYDSNVVFDLEGDDAEWFALERTASGVTVTLRSTIPAAVLTSNKQLVFVVTAQGPATNTARATVIITLTDTISETPVILGFNQNTYLGSIENNQANIPIITISQGYSQAVEFRLHGELSDYFRITPDGASITITIPDGIPQEQIPSNRIIVLEIQATAPDAVPAYSTIVFEYLTEDIVTPVVELIFAQTFYCGSYAASTGLEFPTPIYLSQGYDSNVVFDLEGDDAEWFALERTDSGVTVTLRSTIPAAVLTSNQQLVFVVTAQGPATNTARATVIIELTDYTQPGSDVTFDKVLYEGTLQNGVVRHETITLVGYSGSTVELQGEYSSQFEASLSNSEVTISSGSILLPDDVTHVPLEIHAGTASAVLLIRVELSDEPVPPPTTTVSFDSSSYAFQVAFSHTGLVGRVQATASREEAVTYSLILDNGLQDRLSVNSEGEIHLSLLVNGGLYNFEVAATTVTSLIRATAPAHLSVESAPVCGDEHVMAPLIVLSVDEEELHYDLMSAIQYDNCHFTLTNRWPLNQSWLYVDERGLHATAIDREHESIAFMALSQVQVEVTLVCESTRTKRSLTSDALGPYDYGTNKWILTDNISFNAKRSLVNIIVNDINDNAPIFVGKENEPIVVGYPVPSLAERVLPRSLVELQATDADIGENAALLYWSSEPELAVAPTTGFVHLRDGAVLENGARLTVSATDRNGLGLTGTIDILVRLLDETYIVVVTIKDAFLDDEQSILSSLSNAVGYQLKVLRSVVISGDSEASRKKRDVTSTGGASLQMYIYGLIASEPVSVEQLTTDISNIVTAPVVIASSVSLQDHLEGQEICVIAGRDTGLLVATIVLSVLLFIALALIAVWFFLRWRKNRNYDQFSDENSIASRNVSEDGIFKPDVRPRLDIAELRKSERRLQEMLETPIEEVYVEPINSKNDAIVNIPDHSSIVTIDKLKDGDDISDDEFGEIKTPRRKSVVTFNENVEKIIHLEDTPDADDSSSEPEFEVYQL